MMRLTHMWAVIGQQIPINHFVEKSKNTVTCDMQQFPQEATLFITDSVGLLKESC
jgi:hypothetical protein